MSQMLLPGLLPPVEPPPLRAVSAPTEMIDYPDIPGTIRATHAKRIGAAGERLTDSLLIRWGFHPLEAPESEPYDRLLFVGDDPIKVQVKTVTHPRGGFFTFTLEQGYRRSPGGRHKYRHGAYDIAALVVLPENVIYFSADPRRVQRVATTEIAYLRRKPQASFLDAIAAYRERRALGA